MPNTKKTDIQSVITLLFGYFSSNHNLLLSNNVYEKYIVNIWRFALH